MARSNLMRAPLVLAKFRRSLKHIFYLHIKECEFRNKIFTSFYSKKLESYRLTNLEPNLNTIETIDNIAMNLAPDDEIERTKIKLILNQLTYDVPGKQHPNTKLSSEQIFKHVKKQVARRILKK